MANPALNAIGFILGILFNLYATVVAVRFVMQTVRADYYNPLAQGVVRITDPLLVPLRRVIPSIKRYDTASLVLCFGILLLKLLIFKLLSLGYVPALGQSILVSAAPVAKLVILALLDLIHQLFNVFIFALIIQAVLSWIPGAAGNPVHSLVTSIGEPVLRPLRKVLPPMGGLDLTVFFTIIGLFALRIFLLGTLQQLFGV
ncbi:YggT family protein [Granulosicoccus sp. 3-233]|uniref:YggT family protein n=1 Tax=Granulosicoccus sp. 3-233 TaxID=3417969 RepID=UPI003D328432